jgi:predicted amidophosphoribosyltransferase
LNPLDALRQAISNFPQPQPQPDEDDFAQGFDFCPNCHAPNALNRATCAGCGSALNREGMLQIPTPEPAAPVAPIEEEKPRFSRDLRPSRPTTLKSTPPPSASVEVPKPAATDEKASQPAYDFCTCGVPNALTSRFCAGCGKDLERTGLAPLSFGVPKPPSPIKSTGTDLSRKLIEQGAQRLNDVVSSTPAPVEKPANSQAETGEYDFCTCGVPNALTAKVCVGCGAELPGRQASSPELRSNARVDFTLPAVETGTPEVVFCNHCGVPNESNSLYCAGCGQQVQKNQAAGEFAGAEPPSYAPVNEEPSLRFVDLPRQTATGPICPSCGSGNSPNSTLCFTCGAKLNRPKVETASTVAGLGPLPNYRSPLLMFIFSLLTLDLFRAYWNYMVTREVQDCLGEKITEPSMATAAFLGSCGLYDIYWDWVFSKQIAKMMDKAGIEPVDYSLLFLFLHITVVGKIAIPSLMQINLNEVNQAGWAAAGESYV